MGTDNGSPITPQKNLFSRTPERARFDSGLTAISTDFPQKGKKIKRVGTSKEKVEL
jgi:hypothetical protein